MFLAKNSKVKLASSWKVGCGRYKSRVHLRKMAKKSGQMAKNIFGFGQLKPLNGKGFRRFWPKTHLFFLLVVIKK